MMWRKNRAPAGHGCKGVDLNRNFDVDWSNVGTSYDPCEEIYGGQKPFSELESRNMRDIIKRVNRRNNIKLYLSYHSYGSYIFHPWGFTKTYPKNVNQLRRLANIMYKDMRSYRQHRYTIDSAANVLYKASGGSDDWMKKIGIPLVYCIELPGTNFYEHKSKIVPVVKENFLGVAAAAKYVKKYYSKTKK